MIYVLGRIPNVRDAFSVRNIAVEHIRNVNITSKVENRILVTVLLSRYNCTWTHVGRFGKSCIYGHVNVYAENAC